MDTDRLYPTYRLHDGLDGDTASWLEEQQGDGPLDLASITDMCASHGVAAELRDEHGFTVGYVDAAGSYRLG